MNNEGMRVLCLTVGARGNLQGAVVAATEKLAALEAEGYEVRGLEIKGVLLRKKNAL